MRLSIHPSKPTSPALPVVVREDKTMLEPSLDAVVPTKTTLKWPRLRGATERGAPAATEASVERIGSLQGLRVFFAAIVLVSALAAPTEIGLRFQDVALPLLCYAIFIGLREMLRKLGRPNKVILVGSLLVDGLFLGWVTYASGVTDSPLRFMVYTHIIAMILLISPRMGSRIALWHLFLLFVVFHAQLTGALEPHGSFTEATREGGVEIYQPLFFNALALALVTLGTAPLSSLNERELRRRKGDLEVLARLTQDLENSKGAENVAQTLLDRMRDAFGFERGVVLAAPEGQLTLLAGRQSRRPSAPILNLDNVVRKAWTKRDAVLVDQLDPAMDPALTELLPPGRNLLVVPLIADGEPLGVLVVEQPAHLGPLIEKRTVAMAGQFASHGALAIRNAWLLQQVQRLAETDSLTGIANRRSFERALEREIERAKRYNKELTLVMLDIDHFKNLNDTYGHQAGDEVLAQVGAVLRSCSRESDTPARFGGEEFAVLLPDCPRRESFQAATRLRKMTGSMDAVALITVSAGIATFPAHAHTSSGLVRAADEALYASKKGGRDRATRSIRGSYFRSARRRQQLGLPPPRRALRTS